MKFDKIEDWKGGTLCSVYSSNIKINLQYMLEGVLRWISCQPRTSPSEYLCLTKKPSPTSDWEGCSAASKLSFVSLGKQMFLAEKRNESGLFTGNMNASPGESITQLCLPYLQQAAVQSLPGRSSVLEQLLAVHGRWQWLFHARGCGSRPGSPCALTRSSRAVQHTALCLVV